MKKTLKKYCAMLMVAVLGISTLTGCGTKSGEASNEIKVGVLAPLTGSFAEHGKAFEIAMNMAIDEVNEAGGVNGKKIVLEVSDTEGDNKKAADLAAAFAEDDEFLAILGGFSSGCAMAAAPICDEAGITLISPTASNVAFAQMSDYCFSIPGTSKEEGPIMAINACANYSKVDSVYIFGLNSDWGLSALDGFKVGAEEVGIEIIGEETYASGETDFSAMITKAMTADPDMIVILDQAPGILINQIRTAGVTTPIGNYGASTSNEVITLCGENAEGLITVGMVMDTSRPETKTFVENFTARAKFDPTLYAGYAYVAAYTLTDAMKRCGDNLNRDAIRNEVAATNGDYLFGNLTFNEVGNRTIDYKTAPYKVSEVQNGVWTVVD